jgi:hypothetical protein
LSHFYKEAIGDRIFRHHSFDIILFNLHSFYYFRRKSKKGAY